MALICWFYILMILMWVLTSQVFQVFPLLSRQQPNSQWLLSAPYCNTSQGDWQMNRWGCHMFVKESAKRSLQLTNSSDISLSAIPPLSLLLQLLLAPFGRDTWLVTCLSCSAEKWQIETHLAGRAGRLMAGYQRLCWLMEKLRHLHNVL